MALAAGERVASGRCVIDADGYAITKTNQQTVASPTVVAVASSATNVTLKASNAARRGLLVFNDSTSALFLKYGATATTTTSFSVKIAPGGYWEMPEPAYTGIVDGIWSAANGNALVTELA